VETLDQRTGITWLVSVVQVVMSFFILVGAMFPILVARGPASVSSACIDLKESLNKMVREPRTFFKTTQAWAAAPVLLLLVLPPPLPRGLF
jgi:hypothetical protein